MQKNLTMKQLPDQERPYEKCLKKGAASLSDAELIGVIIRTGARGEKSTDLALRILSAGPDGLLNLIRMDTEDLMEIRGIGEVKAVQLKCVGELARRIASATRYRAMVGSDPETIAFYYMEQMRHETRETLMLAMFDRKNMLLDDMVLSVGTSNASMISPPEIFRAALLKACGICHSAAQSSQRQSGAEQRGYQCHLPHTGLRRLLGIPLMDHIIIGDNCFFSFREQDILTRKGK